MCHCSLAFYELLTEFESWREPCMHSSKLVFLLSACSPHPPFRAVLMSKDVKSPPGKALGWGRKERRAARLAWPSCPCAEFLLQMR